MEAEQEDTYELAAMRAELLGMPAPDREAFEAARKARAIVSDEQEEEREDVERCDVQAATLQEAEGQREELRGVAGGLEELTNILSITQTKLNRFKTVCGSIKNLFKLRDGEASGAASDSEGEQTAATMSADQKGEIIENDHTKGHGAKGAAADINSSLTSQVDKLDSLLMKTERAQMSMESQNKQMRSFLR